MSWFGGGSNDNDSSAGGKDFSNHSETAGFGGGSNFASSGGGGGGASSGVAELQQASMMLQQQMLIQQVINDLTDRGYEKCVTGRPSEQLTGSQAACVKSTVNKWLDSNEFITGRLAKKQQAAASQQGQF
mmetsp:Transcript_34451/g.83087  ORF Transcript_34451/g.83087 Transcript_34451/m.83087 type:complete len:130 (-) Transcript_34451:2981-3370(-)